MVFRRGCHRMQTRLASKAFVFMFNWYLYQNNNKGDIHFSNYCLLPKFQLRMNQLSETGIRSPLILLNCSPKTRNSWLSERARRRRSRPICCQRTRRGRSRATPSLPPATRRFNGKAKTGAYPKTYDLKIFIARSSVVCNDTLPIQEMMDFGFARRPSWYRVDGDKSIPRWHRLTNAWCHIYWHYFTVVNLLLFSFQK